MTEDNKCRELFEAWYANMYPDPIPDYAIDEARVIKDNRWTVWQACNAANQAEIARLAKKLAATEKLCDVYFTIVEKYSSPSEIARMRDLIVEADEQALTESNQPLGVKL